MTDQQIFFFPRKKKDKKVDLFSLREISLNL